MEIEYIAFPERLNHVLWMQLDGVRLYNTNYSYDPDDTTLWRWTKDNGCKQISGAEHPEFVTA